MVLKSGFEDMTVPQVPLALYALERMEEFGDSVAIVDPIDDKTSTFRQIRQSAINLAIKLRLQGVKKGDVVAFVVPLHPNYFPLVVGISLCGAIIVANNVNSKAQVIAKQLAHVKAKFCICADACNKDELQNEAGTTKIIDFDDLNKEAVPKGGDMLEEILTSYRDVDIYNDPAFIAFTSGSTGDPKAVVITSSNLLSAVVTFNKLLGLKKGDCMITVVKQVHLLGFYCFYSYLLMGQKHVITRNLPPELFTYCLRRYQAKGAIVSDFVTFKRLTEEANIEGNTSLKFLISTGASTPKELMQRASEKFNVIVSSAYGCSEGGMTSGCVTEQPPFNSVGYLCPNVQLKVIDIQTGEELGSGQSGELWVKGPCVFKEYLNNKKATDEIKEASGWLHTGDLGYYDQNGTIYIVDRLKNVIKSFENMAVFPIELEAVLLSHPAVAEAVVVRVPHPEYQEAAKAFVVRKRDDLTKEELLEFFNNRVAKYQQLFGGLDFIDNIPKTGLGKPLKSFLV